MTYNLAFREFTISLFNKNVEKLLKYFTVSENFVCLMWSTPDTRCQLSPHGQEFKHTLDTQRDIFMSKRDIKGSQKVKSWDDIAGNYVNF